MSTPSPVASQSSFSGKIPWFICALLIVSIPFGVAAQNFFSFLFIMLCLRLPKLKSQDNQLMDLICLIPAGITVWIIVSTLMNPQNPESKAYEYIFGYLPISLLPFLASRRLAFREEWQAKLIKVSLVLSFLLAATVISQSILGWSLKNPGGGVDYRPFGFFSHPLTLAYVSLLVWPWALNLVFTKPKSAQSWLILGSIGVVLYLTQSRACQALAYGLLLWSLISKFRGKSRVAILTAMLLGAVVTLSTDNPVSSRFSALFSDSNPDRFSDYPDDRLAFWHAHWKMVEEKPILGHGMHLRVDYRNPYYEAIGLENFIKKYEAHNQYLQLWANGGIIALISFCLWLGLIARFSRLLPRSVKEPFLQSLALFVLGSLVQNAYYDSEVRNLIMVGLVLMVAYINGLRLNKHQATSSS